MPYIKQEDRPQIDEIVNRLEGVNLDDGKLNYTLTKSVLVYLKQKGVRYATYNDIVGALECCKLELYIRKIRPYEDTKITENGDVYYQ